MGRESSSKSKCTAVEKIGLASVRQQGPEAGTEKNTTTGKRLLQESKTISSKKFLPRLGQVSKIMEFLRAAWISVR